jgi:ADP-dependent NAD(P)H-hydrate dehydratase / NAD(P)H-hydrate epimerase
MSDVTTYLSHLQLPQPNSHKGQNGKVLLIGGSELFHAASKWSLDIVSKCVDMVFYSSIPSNNQLIQEAKGQFWNGIVVARDQLENYLQEADCVLIGPGMVRDQETDQITNFLLEKYPSKKWVIDAGALQMVQPTLLTASCIITPHQGEIKTVLEKLGPVPNEFTSETLKPLLAKGATVLLKGQSDHVFHHDQDIEISGGNAGMTKGGTGDVLAGLVAGLYATHSTLDAAVIASFVNKKAGELLYKEVGPYFNASDLVATIPKALWSITQS